MKLKDSRNGPKINIILPFKGFGTSDRAIVYYRFRQVTNISLLLWGSFKVACGPEFRNRGPLFE